MTLARKRYQLAMLLQIIDNGPGIPAELKDHIFIRWSPAAPKAPAWG